MSAKTVFFSAWSLNHAQGICERLREMGHFAQSYHGNRYGDNEGPYPPGSDASRDKNGRPRDPGMIQRYVLTNADARTLQQVKDEVSGVTPLDPAPNALRYDESDDVVKQFRDWKRARGQA